MENLFLPHNLAAIAKEKGFVERCFCFHNEDKGKVLPAMFVKNSEKTLVYPTYDQIINWFEEKHKILITPNKSPYGYWTASVVNDFTKSHEGMGNMLYFDTTINLNNSLSGFKTKKEALDKAIETAFKLI